MQKSTFADAAAKLGAAKASAEQSGDTARVQKIDAALNALFARQQQINGNHGAGGEVSFAEGGETPEERKRRILKTELNGDRAGVTDWNNTLAFNQQYNPHNKNQINADRNHLTVAQKIVAEQENRVDRFEDQQASLRSRLPQMVRAPRGRRENFYSEVVRPTSTGSLPAAKLPFSKTNKSLPASAGVSGASLVFNPIAPHSGSVVPFTGTRSSTSITTSPKRSAVEIPTTTLPEIVVRTRRSRPSSVAPVKIPISQKATVPYDPQKTLTPFLSPEQTNLLFPKSKSVPNNAVVNITPPVSKTGSAGKSAYTKPGWIPSVDSLKAAVEAGGAAVNPGVTGKRSRRGVTLTTDQAGNLVGTAANLMTFAANDRQLDEMGREQVAPSVAQPAYTYTDRSRGKADEIKSSARRAMNAVEGSSAQGVNANRQAMLATELGELNQNAAQETAAKDSYDARFTAQRGQVEQTNAWMENQTNAQNRQGRVMRAQGKIANRAALLQAFDDNAQGKADREAEAAQYAIMAPAIDGGRGLQAGQIEQMKTLARKGNKSAQAMLKSQNVVY